MSVEQATKLMQELTSVLGAEYSGMIQKNVDLVNRMKSLSTRHQAIIEQFHSNLNMIESSIAAVEQFSLGSSKVMQLETSNEAEPRKRPRL